MGIKGCTKAYWTAKNVSFYDLTIIYQKLFEKSLPIKLDADVSIMFHSVMIDPKYTYADRITEVASRLSILASYGFVVTPVLDGFDRHAILNQICGSVVLRSLFANQMLLTANSKKDELDMHCKDAASMERQGINCETLPSIKEDLYDKLFQAGVLDKNDMNGGYVKEPIMNIFKLIQCWHFGL